jgi:catechol 2,3-dioxygenase-like lactoylglutathione lyase family enzyme
MPVLKQVRSVLAVRDLASSVTFYTEKLGFIVDFEVEGWCFISRDSFRLMLGQCAAEIPASQLGDHSYFAHVGVDSADALYEEFCARGFIPHDKPQNKSWGIREFAVKTPDGHRIMFGSSHEQDS